MTKFIKAHRSGGGWNSVNKDYPYTIDGTVHAGPATTLNRHVEIEMSAETAFYTATNLFEYLLKYDKERLVKLCAQEFESSIRSASRPWITTPSFKEIIDFIKSCEAVDD